MHTLDEETYLQHSSCVQQSCHTHSRVGIHRFPHMRNLQEQRNKIILPPPSSLRAGRRIVVLMHHRLFTEWCIVCKINDLQAQNVCPDYFFTSEILTVFICVATAHNTPVFLIFHSNIDNGIAITGCDLLVARMHKRSYSSYELSHRIFIWSQSKPGILNPKPQTQLLCHVLRPKTANYNLEYHVMQDSPPLIWVLLL